MGFFFFEFLILPGIVLLIVFQTRRKKAEQKKRETERRFQGVNRPQGTSPAVSRTALGRPAYSGSIRMTGSSVEGPTVTDRVREAPVATVGARVGMSGHVVRPANEADHIHTESSITGFEDCPPAEHERGVKKQPEASGRETQRIGTVPVYGALRFDAEMARNAIIYSEVLGKPKALRR